MKRCCTCKSDKPFVEFNANRSRPDGMQDSCRVCQNIAAKQYRDADPPAYRQKQRDKIQKIRKEVLDAYGHMCACCGEKRSEFLAVDHVNGGGNEERKRLKDRKIYWTVKRDGFPSRYRLLCHNCNMAHGHWGYCPHEIERWAY